MGASVELLELVVQSNQKAIVPIMSEARISLASLCIHDLGDLLVKCVSASQLAHTCSFCQSYIYGPEGTFLLAQPTLSQAGELYL